MGLAVPNFVSGSFKEELSAADAYGMSSAFTSLPVIDDLLNMFGMDFNFSEAFGAANEFIKKNKPLIKDITEKGKIVLGKGSLTERLLAGSSLASTALSGLSPNMSDQMNKYINDNKDTLVKIGDTVQQIQNADISDINGLGKLISSVTGDPTLFSINDKDGISGICSSIVSECSKFGVPNVLTELSKVMPDSSVIIDAAKKLLPDAVKDGDFSMFNEIASIIPNGEGASKFPTAIKDLLTNFKLPSDVKITDLTSMYTKLTDSFNKFDNKWLKDDSPSGIETIQGAAVTTSSDDAKKVISAGILNTNNENEQMLSLAALYGGTDVDHEFFKLYPTIAIGEYQRKQVKTVTPSPNKVVKESNTTLSALQSTDGGYIESMKDAYISIGGIIDPGDDKPVEKNVIIGDPLWK